MSGETPGLRWAVVGASGFVGSAVVAELRGRGLDVLEVTAPRLESSATAAADVVAEAAGANAGAAAAAAALLETFRGVDVVVNAAGLATPGGGESPGQTGANALLPAVIATAARDAGARRLVHLSSASVQGQLRTIDASSRREPFSAYSRSKALGEEALELLAAGPLGITTIRATSVQGPSRPTTLSLAKIARSPLASVAAPGTAPTPVSSIDALAWFVAEVGRHPGGVPAVVLQPWEGLSVREVLAAAGGRSPITLPAWLCRAVLAAGYAVSGALLGERLHGPLRRVELMWFGQEQVPGWAEAEGLVPVPAVARVLEQARTAA
ncbi:NAD-dependent epimerase/dehydratase family protein [Arthrobacter sp. HY1533]|uniref:NAD-dependent epimerase/dehydratase family protein n=1 Tax=Arthrobacter sp. HY1533 TaxID=2970919 RepID=UPI0022BA0612|nr:NAD-dependent epimerase/dehydratase family protein [Arthrobacter sp. HY1533]